MANDSYQLVVRNAPQSGLTGGQVIALEEDVLTLGRDPLSDIILDDPEVSRHHAKLVRHPGGYEIQDMGSTNGSFVDGKRLGGEPLALKPGQVIMLGSNVTLVYQAPAAEAADPLATVVAPAAEAVEEEPPVVEESVEEAIEEADVPMPDLQLPGMEEQEEDVVLAEAEVEDEEAEMATMMDESPFAAPFPDISPEPAAELPEEPEPVQEPEPVEEPEPAVEEPEFVPPPVPEAPQATFEEVDDKTFIDSAAPVSDFAEAPADPPPPPPDIEEPTKDGSNRNIIIIAVVAVLLLCCCLAILSGVLLIPDVQSTLGF